ncbi:Glutathione S-transferase protein [Beauveria brongniartii RCEF 3172]|uniref:Glutathione S-transferase protein n=1 Tax=Beauveria brongniartii RCEF 3172 TaxID=1081107 RepID=A0A167AC86_9HYPO|nr:Glutathione S-transferase protein [Beauveria brongniartii RCEF 3172]
MLYLDLRDDTKHINNDSSRSAAHHVATLIVTHSDGTSTAIRQAVDILDYFEERFPDTCSLLPPAASQPRARALVRDFINMVAVDVEQQLIPAGNSSSNRTSVTGHGFEEQHQRAHVAFRRALASYQQLLESTRGPDGARTCLYTVGDAITLADVCLVPAVEQAVAYGVDMASLQHVARIYSHLKKLPAFTDFDWRKHATASRRL